MKTFTAISNSTIYDVCLNTYGTLDYLVKLMVDNNHAGVDVFPTNGQIFVYDETLVNKIFTSNAPQVGQISGILSPTKYATRWLTL